MSRIRNFLSWVFVLSAVFLPGVRGDEGEDLDFEISARGVLEFILKEQDLVLADIDFQALRAELEYIHQERKEAPIRQRIIAGRRLAEAGVNGEWLDLMEPLFLSVHDDTVSFTLTNVFARVHVVVIMEGGSLKRYRKQLKEEADMYFEQRSQRRAFLWEALNKDFAVYSFLELDEMDEDEMDEDEMDEDEMGEEEMGEEEMGEDEMGEDERE